MALTWLFHLIGDIHHTLLLFLLGEYPNGDYGGNEKCVCVTADRAAIGPAHSLGLAAYVNPQCAHVEKHGDRVAEPVSKGGFG
jgi:hypothetical protein